MFSTSGFIFHYIQENYVFHYGLCFPLGILFSTRSRRCLCFRLLILFSSTCFVLHYLFFQVAICGRKILDICRRFSTTYLILLNSLAFLLWFCFTLLVLFYSTAFVLLYCFCFTLLILFYTTALGFVHSFGFRPLLLFYTTVSRLVN